MPRRNNPWLGIPEEALAKWANEHAATVAANPKLMPTDVAFRILDDMAKFVSKSWEYGRSRPILPQQKNHPKAPEEVRRKTHCKHGHEFTEENTYIRKGTMARACKECRKATARRLRLKVKEADVSTKDQEPELLRRIDETIQLYGQEKADDRQVGNQGSDPDSGSGGDRVARYRRAAREPGKRSA